MQMSGRQRGLRCTESFVHPNVIVTTCVVHPSRQILQSTNYEIQNTKFKIEYTKSSSRSQVTHPSQDRWSFPSTFVGKCFSSGCLLIDCPGKPLETVKGAIGGGGAVFQGSEPIEMKWKSLLQRWRKSFSYEKLLSPNGGGRVRRCIMLITKLRNEIPFLGLQKRSLNGLLIRQGEIFRLKIQVINCTKHSK